MIYVLLAHVVGLHNWSGLFRGIPRDGSGGPKHIERMSNSNQKTQLVRFLIWCTAPEEIHRQMTANANRVTGSDPSVTDYILESPAKCPRYRREICEKTLVEPE